MSPPDDSNKVIIITGLIQGIGQSIANDFASSGYNVLVTSPNEKELKSIIANISSQIENNIRMSFLVGDISEKAFPDTLIEEALKKWDRIDVLINNGKITNNPKITSKEELSMKINCNNNNNNLPILCQRSSRNQVH
jgi:NADP-dependent 3-hydroxy acid dehydrogenase YdfG